MNTSLVTRQWRHGFMVVIAIVACLWPTAMQAQRKAKPTVDFASKYMAQQSATAEGLTCTTISPQMLQQMCQHNSDSPYLPLLTVAKSMRIVSVKRTGERQAYAEAVDALLSTHSGRFVHHRTEGDVSVYVRRRQGYIVEAVFVQRATDATMLFTAITGKLTDDIIHRILFQP